MALFTRLSRFSRSSIASTSPIRRFLCSGAGSGDPSPPGAARWVLLSVQGVGRDTYAQRLSTILGVPAISTRDLLFHELSTVGPSFHDLLELVKHDKTVTDDIIMAMLSRRFEAERAKGISGFLLYGFPQTMGQVESLEGMTQIDRVVNLRLPENVLVQKNLGIKICKECDKTFNVASIDIEGEDGNPSICFSPNFPPEKCMTKLKAHDDYVDEAAVLEKIRENQEKRKPIEEYYRKQGKVVDFDLCGGVAQSWPKLLQALNLEDSEQKYADQKSDERVCGLPHKLAMEPPVFDLYSTFN